VDSTTEMLNWQFLRYGYKSGGVSTLELTVPVLALPQPIEIVSSRRKRSRRVFASVICRLLCTNQCTNSWS